MRPVGADTPQPSRNTRRTLVQHTVIIYRRHDSPQQNLRLALRLAESTDLRNRWGRSAPVLMGVDYLQRRDSFSSVDSASLVFGFLVCRHSLLELVRSTSGLSSSWAISSSAPCSETSIPAVPSPAPAARCLRGGMPPSLGVEGGSPPRCLYPSAAYPAWRVEWLRPTHSGSLRAAPTVYCEAQNGAEAVFRFRSPRSPHKAISAQFATVTPWFGGSG